MASAPPMRALKFRSNLLEVQTYLKKSENFPKILICLGFPEYEFRLAWLYGKI
jgi:hypothetical protein